MTLVDRYLGAVRDNLPREQRDDILEELRDSLASQMEDEAAAKGRPLTETEEADILRAYGHPLAVAARYRGDERTVTFGQRLIGPELFPTYLKVLAINITISVLIGAVLVVLGNGVVSAIGGIFLPIAIQFIAVTAIFVAIDRKWVQDPNGWDPRTVTSMGSDVNVSTLDGLAEQLLGKAQTRAVALTTSVLEIGLMAVALTAWLAIGVPTQIGPVAPGPGWHDVYGPVAVIAAISLATPIITLLRPSWTRFRIVAHIVVDVLAIAVAFVSLGLGSWVVLADPATATADVVKLVDTINGIVRVSIGVAIVISGISVVLEGRRFLTLPTSPPEPR